MIYYKKLYIPINRQVLLYILLLYRDKRYSSGSLFYNKSLECHVQCVPVSPYYTTYLFHLLH